MSQPERLHPSQAEALRAGEIDLIGVSAISCWEISKLVQLGRLDLQRPALACMSLALTYPGISLLPISPQIAALSTQMPDNYRSDPADELIVATAIFFDCPLLTITRKIQAYSHVHTI